MNSSTFAVLLLSISLVSSQRPGSVQNSSCGKNERFNQCGNHCEPKCGQEGGFACILICGPPACICEENLFRHPNGHCATKDECRKQ